jgi:hypothetical protein
MQGAIVLHSQCSGNMLHCTIKNDREPRAMPLRLFFEGKREERIMPILVMWAVPAVIVIGGVGYWLVHMH